MGGSLESKVNVRSNGRLFAPIQRSDIFTIEHCRNALIALELARARMEGKRISGFSFGGLTPKGEEKRKRGVNPDNFKRGLDYRIVLYELSEAIPEDYYRKVVYESGRKKDHPEQE